MNSVSVLYKSFAKKDPTNIYAFLVIFQWDDVSECVLSHHPLPHLLCPSHLSICGVLTPQGLMRRFVYCKVVLTTSLVWVLVDVFLLLYFSECNKCDNKKDHSLLPALRGESDCLTDHRVLLSTCMGCSGPLFILSTYCAPAIALWAAADKYCRCAFEMSCFAMYSELLYFYFFNVCEGKCQPCNASPSLNVPNTNNI